MAEERALDLVDVLNLHVFLLLLDLDKLEESVRPRSPPILFHVALQHFLDIFLRELFRVDLCGNAVYVSKLRLKNLLKECGRELNDDGV